MQLLLAVLQWENVKIYSGVQKFWGDMAYLVLVRKYLEVLVDKECRVTWRRQGRGLGSRDQRGYLALSGLHSAVQINICLIAVLPPPSPPTAAPCQVAPVRPGYNLPLVDGM